MDDFRERVREIARNVRNTVRRIASRLRRRFWNFFYVGFSPERLQKLHDDEKIDDQTYEQLLRERTFSRPRAVLAVLIVLLVFGTVYFTVFDLTPARKRWLTLEEPRNLTETFGSWIWRSLTFQEPSQTAPRIVRFSPQGDVDDVDQIVATFSKSMVTSDSVGQFLDTVPVRVRPDLDAEFIWLRNNRLKIVPNRRIPPGTRVFVEFRPEFSGVDGHALYAAPTYSFVYRPLSLERVNFVGKRGADMEFDLYFNNAVQGDSLAAHLRVEDGAGNTMKATVLNQDRVDERQRVRLVHQTFQELSGKKVYFRVRPGLISHGGNEPLKSSMSERYHFGKLRMTYLDEETGDEQPYLQLYFNRDLGGVETLQGHVKLDVDSSPRLERVDDHELIVRSDRMHFGGTYELTIDTGLRARHYHLGEAVTRTARMPDADPSLDFQAKGVFQNRKGKRVVPVKHVNTDTLYVKAYQIYPNNLVFFANEFRYAKNKTQLFEKVSEATYSLSGERNRFTTDYLNLDRLFERGHSGPKILKYNYDGHHRMENQLLILTDLGIAYKRLDRELVTLVSSLDDGEPIQQARVDVYSRANQRLATALTNHNGVVRMEDVSFEKGEPNAVVVRKGDDVNYLHIEQGRVPTVAFDVDGAPYLEKRELEAFVHGEREIYRPGETVRLKVLARGPRLKRLGRMPLDVTVTGPDGETKFERSVQLDELGTSHFDFETWQDAVTGEYTVKISSPSNDRVVGTGKFQLESFVPDRIETTVSSASDSAVPGEDVGFTMKGQFLFGKPTAGNRARGSYSLVAAPFQPDEYSSFRFGDDRIEFKSVFERLDPIHLNQNGTGSYRVSIPSQLRPPAALNLVFTGTVFERGARGVSARDTVRVHPYPYYIGVKSTTQNLQEVDHGEDIQFKAIAIRPNGTRLRQEVLRAELYRAEWRYSLKEDHRGRVRYEWNKDLVLAKQDTVTLQDGEGTYTYKNAQWGDYRLVLKDPQSGVRTSYPFEVGWWWRGKRAQQKVDFDKLDLQLDQDSYTPDQTAQVNIKAPYDGTAYVFMEHKDINFLKRVTVQNREAEFAVPLNQTHVPNVYLSVLLHRGTRDAEYESYRAIGVTPIRVEAPEHTMNVNIEPPADPTPGETRPVTIHLEDPTGRPVNGEVALSVVDQGILQLAENTFGRPYDFFFRKRANQVLNADVFSRVIAEPDTRIRTTLTPSGAAQQAQQAAKQPRPQAIKQFKAISDWYPKLTADDGDVTIPYYFPEFSGQLTFRAWAASDRRVGYDRSERKIKEPVILDATLPKALAPGDSVVVPFSVTNNLEEPLNVPVQTRVSHHVKLAGGPENIQVAAGERKQYRLTLKVVDNAGAARIDLALSSPAGRVEETFRIPIRPPYPEETRTSFRTLSAGSTLSDTFVSPFLDGTADHRIVISSMPHGKLLSGLERLIRYPYGCIEQTTSSVFPQLYLSRLLKFKDPKLANREKIRQNVNDGIQKLLRMALPSGEFSMWAGGNDPYEYGTIYAAHFLVEAKRAGYPVPDSVLNRIRSNLTTYAETSNNNRLRAYAIYVLALQDHYKPALAKRLLEKTDSYHKYYLVASLVMAGQKGAVEEYLYETSLAVDASRSTKGVLSSTTVGRAVVLNALIEAGAPEERLRPLVSKLLRSMAGQHHWGSTHDNAQTLIALGKFYRDHPPEEPNFEGIVTVNGGEFTQSFTSANDTAVSVSGRLEELSVESRGDGVIHVSVIRRGIPTPDQREDVTQGMRLKHRFYTLEGEPYDRRTFTQGKLYVAETVVKTHADQGNLYFEDILPGGFQIENPRLASRATDVPFVKENVLEPDYADIRDDRIVVFFDGSDDKDTYRYRYLVRAVNQGHFTYPALSGGSMYDPDVEAIQSLPSIFVVRSP